MKIWKAGMRWAAVFGVMGFLSGCAADVVIAPPPGKPLPPLPRVLLEDLRVLDLDFFPDPVREGERLRFRVTIFNQAPHGGRLSLAIRDRNETVAEAREVLIRPGQNRIEFPWTGYRFSRSEHCFLVELDLERTRKPVDAAKAFCAWRTQGGWTMSEARIGPFFVEDLEMHPDPVYPREEVRFKVRLRNEGRPVRANLWIQDRDQVVTRMEDVPIRQGYAEYPFPYSRYAFQKADPCFTVFLDVERTRQKVDAKKAFCAKQLPRGRGWTLQP